MNEPGTPQAVSVQGFDPRQLFSKGFNLGCVDLIQGGSFPEVVGRTVIALLMGLRDKDNKGPFAGVSVILPPASATGLTAESVLDAMVSGIEALRGSEPSAKELEVLKRVVRVVSCSTLEVADLVETILQEGQRRLVAVAEASIYRDQSIAPPSAFGLSAVLTSEDLWVPHVTSLCCQCVSAVKAMSGYAVVHVDDNPAVRRENQEQLLSIDDCYVACLAREQDAKEVVDRNAQRWLSLVLRGAMTEAVAEIDRLQLSEVNRLHILAQLFSRAGKDDETLDTIAQLLPHLSSLNPANLVQLSQLAHKAGDNSLALMFLPEDAECVTDVMWLEQGLELATQLENNTLIERYDKRLTLIYPRSERLRENRDRRLLLNCRNAKLDASVAFTTAGFTEYHLALQDGVLSHQPEYDRVIEQAREWGPDWLEFALICCAMHAWSVGHSRDAADVASQITTSALYGRQATQITLSSVRALMLRTYP